MEQKICETAAAKPALINIHTGKDARYILASDPDPSFVTDETVGLLYSANDNKLQAFDILSR